VHQTETITIVTVFYFLFYTHNIHLVQRNMKARFYPKPAIFYRNENLKIFKASF